MLELQTKHGVKDKIASYWIEKLLIEARRLKAENRNLSEADISTRCLDWLSTQTSCPMSPLLHVPSASLDLYFSSNLTFESV